MIKNRSIEMGVCYTDNTWCTYFIDIPTKTPTNQIEEVGRNCLISNQNWIGVDNIAHIWLYNSMDEEEILNG